MTLLANDLPRGATLAHSLVARGLAVAVVLAACSSDGSSVPTSTAPVVQLGGPGETSRVLSAEEVAALTVAPAHTEADVVFVSGMIHHHRQALEVTALVPDRAGRADLSLLAERMTVGQTDEIALLERWLTDRGEPLTSHGGDDPDHGPLMPGMLTADELAALAGASGEEFDAAFLSAMIRHHEGAVAMVEQLIADGGGHDSSVFQMASDMSLDQSVEIARMKTLLVEVAPEATSG